LIGQIISAVTDETIELSAEEIVAATLIVALEGIEAAQKKLIQEVVDGKADKVLPNVSSFVSDGSQNAEWMQTSGFIPQSAELNDALVFGGLVDSI
jgi:hypothetical protein